MARPPRSQSQASSQWVYLMRFFVGRSGEVGCQIRDISTGEVWIEADARRAEAALDAIERTRPQPGRQKS